MEETTRVELCYAELCTLLESGTVQPSSALYVKLRAARDGLRREPARRQSLKARLFSS